jgi:hypothetical protein
MSTDYPPAQEMLVPDANIWPNIANTRKWLVLHKTAGGSSAQETAAYFQNNAPQADGTFARTSVHYVVGMDGAVVQCVRETDAAGGNCCLEPGHDTFWPQGINENFVTFSIESVDPATDNSTTMPQAQKDALFPLVRHICTKWNIPMRPADANGGIAGHMSLAPQSRARCPGNFPWNDLWAYLKGQPSMNIPLGWHDDGATLTAPNGHTVTGGFRDHVLASSWAPDNVPLENQVSCTQTELAIKSGVGIRQLFRTKMLVWYATRGVLEAWVGAEVLACYQLLHH